MIGGRPLADVLGDILGNLQEMIRAEMRLAKAELRAEALQTRSSMTWIAAGGLSALSAWLLFLWSLVYVLAAYLPMWAATLVVAGLLAAGAALLLTAGIRRLKRVQPIPQRTIHTVKENVAWLTQSPK